MQKIIALTGIIGSGKDTVGDILVKEYHFKKISFASKLKDIISIMFDWDRERMEGLTEESRAFRNTTDKWWSDVLGIEDFSPRKAMQVIGTDVIRNCFHDQIWGLSVFKDILDHPNTDFVITDCRFSNEIMMVKKFNGTIWRVKRGHDPDFLIYARNKLYHKIETHISEYDWIHKENMIDGTINNDGTLEHLTETVRQHYSYRFKDK